MADASVVAVITDGKVLILKRSSVSKLQGWSLPGGMRENGETDAQTALRELREETGIQADEKSLVYVSNAESVRGLEVGIFAIFDFHKDAEISLSSEHTDYAWVDEDSPISAFAGNTDEFIKKARAKYEQISSCR